MEKYSRRILFVRLSAVGDVINTLPALDALRKSFPDAYIGYAVEDRAYSAIEGHPCVDFVHLYPRKRWVEMFKKPGQWKTLFREIVTFFADIRKQRYEIVLNYQSNLKGALFALLSKAPLRAGFAKQNSKESSHVFNHINVSPEGGELINRSMIARLGENTDLSESAADRPRRKSVPEFGQVHGSDARSSYVSYSTMLSKKEW